MSYFEITNSPSEKFTSIVFTTGVDRPVKHFKELEKSLKSQNKIGFVFFDFLIANGISSHRFYKSYFDGQKIEELSPAEPDSAIINTTINYYKNNIDKFDTALLSNAVRYALKNGIKINSKNQ